MIINKTLLKINSWKSDISFEFWFNRIILKYKVGINDGTLNLIFCCRTLWGHQAISVTLSETSAPVHRYSGSFLVSKALRLSQVWRAASPACMFQLLPQMFFSVSVNMELMGVTKTLQFSLICPKFVLPEALWFINMHFGKFQSLFLWFASSSDALLSGWCDLTLI